MHKFNQKQKELLLISIERSLKALEKCVANCLKEKQTDAAGKVNEDIKILMALSDDIRDQKV